MCCIFFSATKFITTHCQFDGINHWPGVINGDEVSKNRVNRFIAETISKQPRLDVHLVHTRMSSNSSGQNKNKIKGMTINGHNPSRPVCIELCKSSSCSSFGPSGDFAVPKFPQLCIQKSKVA